MSAATHTPMHHRAEHGVTRSLVALLARVEHTRLGPDRVVNHATQDSREIGPGGIFVATRGSSWDGHGFIAKALAAGASAIIAERHPEAADGFEAERASWVVVPDALYALACIAAAWYGHPGREVPVLATTGTNGKTTTSYLLRQVADQLGKRTGLISTVEILVDRDNYPTIFTTPPSPEFQRLLADMRDSGCDFAIVEASSHGLHQHRIAAFEVAVAGFTNLSRDHLDYHPTMEAYEAAKATLFTTLTRAACINIDSPAGRRMAEHVEARALPLVTVSPSGQPATLSAHEVHSTLAGLSATIQVGPIGNHGPRTLTLRSPLIGRHNLENLLVALGMATLAGLDLDQVALALASAIGAPGRLERVQLASHHGEQPAVFVDYAHSPDALDNVLSALRPLVPGKLVCVFGAGGDRDKGKRPEMAKAAARHADRLVLTSDNPRTEDPEAILDDIAAGLTTEHHGRHHRIADRAEAIALAIADAGPDDAVLIAGKGHEDYQIVGTTRHPFDDRAVAQKVLERRQAAREVTA